MQIISDIEASVSSMNDRLGDLEARTPGLKVKAIFNAKSNEKLFWALTPKHHALLQLELFSFSDVEIGNRLGTSEMAARSSISHLRTRLKVPRRDLLSSEFLPIFLDADDKKYLENAKIPKSWAKSYGLLSNEQAESQDPFFKVVNARYRAPRT